MKMMIFIGITIGGGIGSLIGAKMDGGFGVWSILFGGLVGPILGLWAGFKAAKNLGLE